MYNYTHEKEQNFLVAGHPRQRAMNMVPITKQFLWLIMT
jgi:hypothetical protein